MKFRGWILIVGLLFVVGCQSKSGATGTQTESGPGRQAPTALAKLAGSYNAKIEVEKASADDPAAKMAESVSQMFMAGTRLELKSSGEYSLFIVGLVIEGHASLDGERLTLVTKTIGGLTPEEFKKVQAANPSKATGPAESFAEVSRPMVLEIQADGKMVTVGKNEGGKMIFTKEQAPDLSKSSVPEADRSLIGRYRAEIPESKPVPNETEVQRLERKMDDALMRACVLDLNADGSFAMQLVMQFKGQWKKADNRLNLEIEAVGLMPGVQDPSQKKETIVFEILDGGQKLKIVPDQSGAGAMKPITFERDAS